MSERVLLLGAGGLAREIASQFPDIAWGFFADDGKANDALDYGLHPFFDDFGHAIRSGSFSHFVPAVGSPTVRSSLADKATLSGLTTFGPLLHPQSFIDSSGQLGPGSVVFAGARVSRGVSAGKGVIVNFNAVVGHDTRLDSFVTVAPGAILGGNVSIGECSEIGMGAMIHQGCKVGSFSLIGMGTIVTSHVAPSTRIVSMPRQVQRS